MQGVPVNDGVETLRSAFSIMAMNPEDYMMRALQLARNGALSAHPNPMVGAVIVARDGRIIGEGWHRCYGEGHAEVNAVASVSEADRPLLSSATMYVTLEPCSHYGKTPPCAKLIIETGIPNVVVATADPFAKVQGRGLQMLREAGVNVEVGMLGDEARALNRAFMTAHTLKRPYVTLKWAQSADGFIDGRQQTTDPAVRISSRLGKARVHRLRAMHDAILVGSGTYFADAPSLTVRHYAGKSPKRYVADRRGRIKDLPEGWTVAAETDIAGILSKMYADGVTSLLVEGGRALLQSFLDSGLYDDLQVEVHPTLKLADCPIKTPAPTIKHHV